MPTIALNDHETSVDGARPQTEPFVLSIPDAERLVLQSRFVRNSLKLKSSATSRPVSGAPRCSSPRPFPEIS